MIILDHPHHNQPHHPGNTVLLFSLVITLLLEQRIKSFSREIGGLRLVTGACRIVDVLLTLRRPKRLVLQHVHAKEAAGKSVASHCSESEDGTQDHVSTFVGKICIIHGGVS